jgi:hypothetical protein
MMRQLMGSVSLSALVAAQLALAAPAKAAAHTYIIGLAEGCGAPTAALSNGVMELFVKGMGPGDKLIAYDASRRTVIAKIAVPDSEIFRQPAVRVQQFGGQLVQLRRFLEDRCRPVPSGAPKPDDNLYTPQYVEAAERDVVAAEPRGTVSMMLVGSALYQDPRDPGLSMADAHYPSDSFLNASATASVFSTVDRHASLAGVDVHYCYTDPAWSSDAHKEAVLRFWLLYIGTQGGKLAMFTGDLPTCFERFDHAITAGAPSFTVEASYSHELKMLLAQRAPITRQVVAAAPSRALSPVPPAVIRTQPAPVSSSGTAFLDEHAAITRERPQTLRGLAKIGIRWSCDVDLDIYARGSADMPFLYYNNKNSTDGNFPHDYTNSPGQTAFEYVEFTRPIDLMTMQAFVNFYGGTCPTSPSGQVRLWFQGHVYEGHFALEAHAGNSGGKVMGAMAGPDWTEIDIKKLLHLE